MSTDASRVELLCAYLHFLWLAPVQICLALALLIVFIGPAALTGFAVFVLFIPCQAIAMRYLIRYRKKGQQVTDQRVKLTQEILQGMRVIKFFAWEPSFLKKLLSTRSLELHYVRIYMYVKAVVSSLSFGLPVVATVTSLLVYSAVGNVLNPAVVFTAMALFKSVSVPLNQLPLVIGYVADTIVSLRRIQELLTAEELQDLPTIDDQHPFAIQVIDGNFEWDALPKLIEESKDNSKTSKKNADVHEVVATEVKDVEKGKDITAIIEPEEQATIVDGSEILNKAVISNVADAAASSSSVTETNEVTSEETSSSSKLSNINFEVNRGEFVAIVGPVGAGKSSLLNALVGEMKKDSGSISFGGKIAYCPQSAWIQNASVKENILFGLAYDDKKYKKIIDVCALEADLNILPGISCHCIDNKLFRFRS